MPYLIVKWNRDGNGFVSVVTLCLDGQPVMSPLASPRTKACDAVGGALSRSGGRGQPRGRFLDMQAFTCISSVLWTRYSGRLPILLVDNCSIASTQTTARLCTSYVNRSICHARQ